MITAWLLSAAVALPPGQLMDDSKRQSYIDALPTVDDEELTTILNDPSTIWYTSDEMPPAFQRWRFARSQGVISASINPRGNAKSDFPWAKPAGTHLSHNVQSVKFIHLPERSATRRWPIVWHQGGVAGWPAGHIWWTFPKDTVVGEVLFQRRPETGELKAFELRVRKRELEDWGVDIFRPYATEEALVKALDSRGRSDLAEELKNAKTRKERLRSKHDERPFNVTATRKYLEPWPANLIDDLLDVPFVSAVGVDWSHDVDGLTTWSDYHIVPTNYTGSHAGNERIACMQCHGDTSVHVSFFDRFDNRRWSGSVPGSDGILSFHPFDTRSISTTHIQPIGMRPELKKAGLIERFAHKSHPPDVYRLTHMELESRQKNVVRVRSYPR